MEYIIAIIIFAAYFIPAIVSYGNKNHGSVVVINLFLGWTFLGWVVALAMAFSGEKEAHKTKVFYEEDPLDVGDDKRGDSSRQQAISKLKEAKDLVHIEMMTQEEFDKLKKELAPIIWGYRYNQ